MPNALITHPVCAKHEMGSYHPESPARLAAIEEHLIASGLYTKLQHYDAPQATREQLLRVHKKRYLDSIEQLSPREGLVHLDPDTAMNAYTFEAALRAAGAAVLATDLVMRDEVKTVFCSIRPPGHHACSDHAMGFCIFNNIAVGAAHALTVHGLTRVAIADFDVHHGNGTEEIFHDNPRVMLCSTFQHPFYPYSGANSGNDHIINVALPEGAGSREFQEAVRKYWIPALKAFQPQLLFISAGFDAHREERMAGMQLVEADYIWVTEQLKEIAQRYCQGRVVSILEGGYALPALGLCAVAHIGALIGINVAQGR